MTQDTADGSATAELPFGGVLAGSCHRFPIKVYFEDTDAAGIVYHANYLRFAERGRTEMMRLIGCDHNALVHERGLAFAIRRASLDYQRPARLGELLEVVTQPYGLGRTAMSARQHILAADGPVCAVVDITAVCVRLTTGRPQRLPEDVRAALAAYAQPPAA